MTAGVELPVSCEAAFDYLVDPANRPQWQSSLRAVDHVLGESGVVGQTWTDVTVVGVRPRMELTDADRPHRWSERGRWRGFDATLTLTFSPAGERGERCEVVPVLDVHGRGPLRPVGGVLRLLAPRAVRGDLARAARLLA